MLQTDEHELNAKSTEILVLYTILQKASSLRIGGKSSSQAHNARYIGMVCCVALYVISRGKSLTTRSSSIPL